MSRRVSDVNNTVRPVTIIIIIIQMSTSAEHTPGLNVPDYLLIAEREVPLHVLTERVPHSQGCVDVDHYDDEQVKDGACYPEEGQDRLLSVLTLFFQRLILTPGIIYSTPVTR